jgi:heat shock protein HslJ
MMLLCLAFVMALTPLFATATTPAAGAPDIAPHVWAMDSFTPGDDAPVAVSDPERYTAQFLPGGRATFRLDCNSGQADYTAADGSVALTNLATTAVDCPTGSHSEAFAAGLINAESYRFDDTGNLILRGPQGALRLRPLLTGVTWQWQGITDSEGVIFVSPPAPERYTLAFLADGALAIRADCNRARAHVRMDGIAMAIRMGGVTRMACRADSLGALYLFGLNNVEHWYLFNGVLSLALPDGADVMIFGPAVNTGAIPPGAE